MKLEDVASRFHKPCILDLKVRRRHFTESTDRQKIENERRKYPLQEVLGFRISGMRVSTMQFDLVSTQHMSCVTLAYYSIGLNLSARPGCFQCYGRIKGTLVHVIRA